MAAELVELRLPAFKSVREAVVPLGPLTVVVGRNGSGKSNVLDGLAVLSAIAQTPDLREALDGGRTGPLVRGGSEGCAPVGEPEFRLGATTRVDGVDYHLDVTIGTTPSVQILSERLWTLRRSGPKKGEAQDLLKSDPAVPYSTDIVARWDNGKRGTNPPISFRATQLLTAQVATRVPSTSSAGRHVHSIAAAVLGSLSGIFVLDPIPHQMREYVPEKDFHLRRNAENLSAVLRRLMALPDTRELLLEMTRSLSEAQVSDLSSVASDLGDVMATVKERIGGAVRPMPARLMSDGTLRFLAIAAAILDTPVSGSTGGEAATTSSTERLGSRLLVIEELENGLHPSQASLLLDRLKDSSGERQVRTLATTHSPAMLDALAGADHENVVVCSRRTDGWSRVTRLTDFPDYFEVAGRASLGDTAVRDQLRPGSPSTQRQSLAHLLGA